MSINTDQVGNSLSARCDYYKDIVVIWALAFGHWITRLDVSEWPFLVNKGTEQQQKEEVLKARDLVMKKNYVFAVATLGTAAVTYALVQALLPRGCCYLVACYAAFFSGVYLKEGILQMLACRRIKQKFNIADSPNTTSSYQEAIMKIIDVFKASFDNAPDDNEVDNENSVYRTGFEDWREGWIHSA